MTKLKLRHKQDMTDHQKVHLRRDKQRARSVLTEIQITRTTSIPDIATIMLNYKEIEVSE